MQYKNILSKKVVLMTVLLLGSNAIWMQPATAEPLPLDQIEHIHGITTKPGDSSTLLLATHYGLFLAKPDGYAKRLSPYKADMMSFAVSPENPQLLFASGHSEQEKNTGVMASKDGGTTWTKISDGAKGPVDFHTMAISPINPDILYGTDKTLQKSIDGGKNWTPIGNTPEKLFSLAASARAPSTLYAATMDGLKISRDEGKTWQPGFVFKKPATMVYVTADARMFVFIYGKGLLSAKETDLQWKTLSSNFQDRALMNLTVDPVESDRMFAVTNTTTLMTSADGGRRWTTFEGMDKAIAGIIKKGETLFAENCQQCHGVRGIGERPGDPAAKDDFGFVAPALNDDAHGWHHSDRQLVETILNGSPRNKRMIAWKETLSRQEVEAIVTYIKSLWSFRSLACQGAKHMACM
jgi:mono/diheme cytochrome c family protein